MLKHTVTNCTLQHYYAHCVNILPKDGYYYQVKNVGKQLVGNNYLYKHPLHRRCTISNYNHMSHIIVITPLCWFNIFYIFIFL
jgi:hypothetical protein